MSMSGKIAANSGFVTKADFTRLQSKVEGILTRLAEYPPELRVVQQTAPSPSLISNRKFTGGVKSWLYSKAGSRTPRTQRASPDVNSTCHSCGRSDSGCGLHCDHVSEASRHIYHKHEEGLGGNDNHRSLRNEFNQLQADVSRDIRTLQKSVKDAMELCQSLEKLIYDSLANMQATIDKMSQQLLENTERPNQQSCQDKLRNVDTTIDGKNINGLNNGLDGKGKAALSGQRLRKNTHTFEWEVINMDSIVKNQKEVSSQPYHIEDLDYRMRAAAFGHNDGRLRMKIYGEFVQTAAKTFSIQRKSGKFECAVYVIDKSGKQLDWLLGNVGGDFTKDKELMVGDIYLNETKRKGYVTQDGNVNLRFHVDVFD